MIRIASAGIVGQCGIGRSDRIRAMMSAQKPPGRRTRRTACSVLLRDLLRGSKEFSKSSHHFLLRSRRHASASFTIRYLFIIVIFCLFNFYHLKRIDTIKNISFNLSFIVQRWAMRLVKKVRSNIEISISVITL